MVSPEPSDADLFIDYNIETAFSSFEILKAFEKRAKERDVIIYGHLYIDTGMHRDGMAIEDAIPFMDYVKNNTNIKITGLMTHLATADMPEINFADKQIERFESVRQELNKLGFKFKYIHCSNSAGILNYSSAHYNMVRPGISIYGLMSNKKMTEEMNLKPVLSWKSKVMHCVNVPKGDYIGYSNSPAYPYFAKRDMIVAVVPSGYADGLPRNLTNKLQCLINGKRFNSVGSICMDEFMVDITDSDVKQGDEVVIIGKQGNEEISVYELAKLADSIPYERTAAISDRVKRIFV
jgi:alanine racemase